MRQRPASGRTGRTRENDANGKKKSADFSADFLNYLLTSFFETGKMKRLYPIVGEYPTSTHYGKNSTAA